MNAYCKTTADVTTLLAAHEQAWAAFDAAYPAPDDVVEKLCNVHEDLFRTAPASMSEWFKKWDVVRRSEMELGEEDDIAWVITRMMKELENINGRCFTEAAE